MTKYFDAKTNEEKIDNAPVNGLLGTKNSLAYRIAEIERHIHAGARWLGVASAPVSGTHEADRIGTTKLPFTVDAGNNDWGAWKQIVGSGDTPVISGNLYFDPHQIYIDSTEHTATYFLQIGRGATGAGALSAGTYTEIVIGSDLNKFKDIIQLQTGRAPVGSKLWARTLCIGKNTSELKFYLGIHEYDG